MKQSSSQSSAYFSSWLCTNSNSYCPTILLITIIVIFIIIIIIIIHLFLHFALPAPCPQQQGVLMAVLQEQCLQLPLVEEGSEMSVFKWGL